MSLPILTLPIVLTWIHNRLIARPTLTALIGGGSPRIETDIAKDGIAFPYVLITVVDPGRPQYVLGARAIAADGIYLVRGVAMGRSYGGALQTIATEILLALHNQEDYAAGIGSSVLQEEYRLAEVQAETHYRHLGGIFGISVQTNA